MEQWSDQGIVLSARGHGEGGAVVTLLTETMGLHAGYLHGGQSSSKRPLIECGNLLQADWTARVSDQLGTYKLEPLCPYAAQIMGDKHKLAALLSACALCDAALPEREAHPDLFHSMLALMTVLGHDALPLSVWGEVYIKWEISLLRELGFSLDFTRCAGGGDAHRLAYISPKSGCAVSYEAGEAYKDKLLPLPSFLKPNGGPAEDEDIRLGLELTYTFLEKWAFAHHTKGVPLPRIQLQERFSQKKTVGESGESG